MSSHKKLLEVVEELLRQALILTEFAESSLDLAQNLRDTGIGELAGLIEQLIYDCDLGITKLQGLSSLIDETREIIGRDSGYCPATAAVSAPAVNSASPLSPDPDLAIYSGENTTSNSSDLLTSHYADFELHLSDVVDRVYQLQKSISKSGSKTITGMIMLVSMLGAATNHPVTKTLMDGYKRFTAAAGVYEIGQKSNNLGKVELKDVVDWYLKMSVAEEERRKRTQEKELDASARAHAEKGRTLGTSS